MTELVSLGGFKNVRSDFDFEGVKLELDETQFDWGTVYEIEVETVSVPTFSFSLPCAKIMEDSSLVITGFSDVLWMCMQPEPEKLKPKLELLLKSRDIPYAYNTTTKFANFVNRTLK